MSQAETCDVIVVGLGAIGAATLYQLAKRGARVLGIDRHNPPHDQGSSHGESRISRLAVGEGDAYVPLVKRSHEIWRELEAVSGRSVFTTTAGLIMAPRDRLAEHHGKSDFVRRTIEVAERHDIAHEVLDAPEIRRRYPQFALRGNELGYWEHDSGFIRPEEAIRAQLDAARSLGARVLTNTVVNEVTQPAADGAVHVRTDHGSFSAGQVLVSAGAWLPNFLQAQPAWQPHFSVHRQVMHWFDVGAHAADFEPGRFPIFIWMFGDDQEDYMYGFPSSDAGAPALKVATEQYVAATTPDTVNREVSAEESAQMHATRVAGRIPQASAKVVQARACLYTVTTDRQFVIDRFDNQPGVLVASACSGHGFKHSAGLGEALALELLGKPGTVDLSAFSLARL